MSATRLDTTVGFGADDAGSNRDSPRSHAFRRKEARRRMLRAAYEIVARGGFDTLTLAGVGEAAGYSRALPAHYFKSRDELIAALGDGLRRAYARHIRYLTDAAGGMDDLVACMEQQVDLAAREFEQTRVFEAFLGAALSRPQLAAAARQLNEDTVAQWSRLIRVGQANGSIRSDLDAHSEGRLVTAVMRGLILQYLIDPDHFPLQTMRDQLVDDMRTHLAPRPVR